MRLPSAPSALRYPDFVRMWLGQTVSAAGNFLLPVALAARCFQPGGGGPKALGAILAVRTLANIVLLIVGGVWADRLRRTRVMIGSDAVRIVAVLTIALLPVNAPILGILLAAALMGAGEAFFQPAYAAVVPSVLPDEEIGAGNALSSISIRAAAIGGPAGAALLIHAFGQRVTFLVDAATFLVSIVSLAGVREPPREMARERLPIIHEAREGLRAVQQRPWLAGVIGAAGLQLMLAISPLMILVPLVATERWGGVGAYGVLMAWYGVGGVLGALAALRWRPKLPGLVGTLGWFLYALIPLGLLMHATFREMVAIELAAGLGLEPFLIYWMAGIQRDVPRALHARVFSMDWLCSSSLQPIGLALSAPAIAVVGRTPILITSALAVVIPSGLLLLVPGVMQFATPKADDRRQPG